MKPVNLDMRDAHLVLRGLREKLGLTQADVAQRLLLTPQQIGRWEREGISSLPAVFRYAGALGYAVRLRLEPKEAS